MEWLCDSSSWSTALSQSGSLIFGQLRWAMWLIRRRVGSPAEMTTGAALGCRKAMRDPEGTAFDIN
jgi:hypothetical protein